MTSYNTPFRQIANYLKDQPILPFRENTALGRKYLKAIQGKVTSHIFIGWICERDSFFAYLYKCMKKEARDCKTTRLAAKIARAGFPIMLTKINGWISKNNLPVLVVPVPSHYGASERFAVELYKMLDKNSKKVSKIQEVFNLSDKSIEIKKIDSWVKRNRAVNGLFSFKKGLNLNQYAVLLVDDIVTSGSSLRECANLLKKCGAGKVAAVSLATNLFDNFSYRKQKK